jgi:hypothetical protein
VSEFTADQIREDTMDRVESPTARKFAQGVVGVHTNEDRNPSDMFDALSRAVSYARVDTGDEMSTGDEMGTSTPFTPTIHMHFDRVMAANDKPGDIKSIVNLLRAIALKGVQHGGHAMSLKSERYIDGLNYRAIKSLGACKGQAVSAITFCIPKNSSSKDASGATWSCKLERTEGDYVVGSAVSNGLTWLQVGEGDAIELVRLQHFTSPAPEPSVSLVVDVCGERLEDVATYMEGAFESVAFADAAAPALDVSLVAEGPPRTKAYHLLVQKDPEQLWREAHELFHSNLELIDELAYIKMFEQPATEKAKEAKEAEGFTCIGCNVPYTDATSSGAKTTKNSGYCSKTCREAPRAPPKPCMHGRQKSQCKDCGTGHCLHGRRKDRCKDCRSKAGAGYCQHGRLKYRCKDCGTGYCQHGRQRGRCMEC